MRNAGMDDLVKRLRMVYGNHTEADIALHREAADEIDRLRELLQRALFAFQHKGVVRGIDEWCEQAEAAIRADAAQPAAQEPADCRCPGYCFARTGNRHRLPGNVRCGITGLLAHPADAAQEPRPADGIRCVHGVGLGTPCEGCAADAASLQRSGRLPNVMQSEPTKPMHVGVTCIADAQRDAAPAERCNCRAFCGDTDSTGKRCKRIPGA
jgi:hypothetical protein